MTRITRNTSDLHDRSASFIPQNPAQNPQFRPDEAPTVETDAAEPDDAPVHRPTFRTASDARDQARAVEDRIALHLVGPQTMGSDARSNLGAAQSTAPSGAAAQNAKERERERALDVVEDNFATFDNPGGGSRDGIVSDGDLRTVANGRFSTEIKDAAQLLLDDDQLRNQLDVANGRGKDDNKFSRSDLFALRAERAHTNGVSIEDRGQPRLPYTIPSDSDPGVRTDDSNRTTRKRRAQETAVLEALETGQPVEFTNTEGQTESIQLEQLGGNGKDDVGYQLTAEDGSSIKIESSLSYAETQEALGRITDYFTQVPERHRDKLSTIKLEPNADPDGSAGAEYTWESRGLGPFNRITKQEMTFYGALQNLSEATFDHEMGHAVSKNLPSGYEEAIEADGARPGAYSAKSPKEDFAETWALYVEAQQRGSAAVAELERAFPNRFKIVEDVYKNG